MAREYTQSATSCPGGSDPKASDCLQIFNPDGSQLSLLAITEQDELDFPGRAWSISGVVDTNTNVGQWIDFTEPPGPAGVPPSSDVVGIPAAGVLAFVSDPADFSSFPIFSNRLETNGPLDVTILLSPAAQEAGFKAFFQSDLDAAPEPATWAMLMLGFAGLVFAGLRRPDEREATLG